MIAFTNVLKVCNPLITAILDENSSIFRQCVKFVSPSRVASSWHALTGSKPISRRLFILARVPEPDAPIREEGETRGKFHFCFVPIDRRIDRLSATSAMSIAGFPWPELFPVNILPNGQQLDIIKKPSGRAGAPSTAKLHVKLGRTRTHGQVSTSVSARVSLYRKTSTRAGRR